jgi:hypothetical protein
MNARPTNDSLITPVFKTVSVRNEAGSRKAGRAIFEDVEMVEIRIAGDRNFAPCYPAHSFWRNIDGIPHTYAMRWPDQYRRFKDGLTQAVSGTPLEELPFLTPAKRSELKALGIYTADALSLLDGKNLKTLGIGGRELKTQAKAYLDRAAGSADVVELARQNAAMRAEIDELKAMLLTGNAPPAPTFQPAEEPQEESEFGTWSEAELRGYLRDATGVEPKGKPSHETLVSMCEEAAAQREAA